MKIKWLYISLSLLSVSLLLGSVAIIYHDGTESIAIQKEDNSVQLSKSLLFMDFVAKYKAYIGTDYNDSREISRGFDSYFDSLNKLMSAIENENHLKVEYVDKTAKSLVKKFEAKVTLYKNLQKFLIQEKSTWLQVETTLSDEIVLRMKKGEEFLPEFKKTLSRWATSLSFLEKVKNSIDVSYVNQEKFTELQDLMGFSKWLIEVKEKNLSKESEVRSVSNEINSKLSALSIPEAVKVNLLEQFKSYFNVLKSINRLRIQERSLITDIRDLRTMATNHLNDDIFPKWQMYISAKYDSDISQRYKRLKSIVDSVSVIGVLIILSMLVIFLNIFPYLGRLEVRAKQVAAGNFQAKFFEKVPNNEIGKVMKAFNEMSSEISKHILELNKKEEEQIQLTDSIQRMRKISEMGEFSAKMAHELKNPISILTFCLSDAVELIRNGSLDKCQLELEKSITALERLKVTASKLGAKNLFSEHEVINLNILLSEVGSMYKALLKTEEISLNLIITQNDTCVVGPRLELLGAISNLMDNAIEYLKTDKLSDQIIDLTLNEENGLSILKISNKGNEIIGSDRIFNNFYSTKDGNMRGLGLVIVKDVVENIKGSISYNYENRRNTFTIKIPIA